LRLGTGALVGNGRAVKHGAYARIAERELEEKTREIFTAIAADAPVRDNAGGLPSHDAIVVRMLAELLVRRERVRVEELRHGLETKDGRMRGVVEYGLRIDNQLLDLCREMGLTPASRARLGLDLVRAASASDQLDEHLRSRYGDGGDVVDVDAEGEGGR
jgi:hypothetical protein